MCIRDRVMGKSMVSHLLNQGDEVTVYNRTAAKAEALKEKGAQVAYTVADAVKDADLIFTIVGFPKDVEEVYTEIFKAAKPGALAVDMTTSSPSLAVKLHQQGKEHQIRVLDAPVSGGDSGAAAGTLSIMVGGEEADVYKRQIQHARRSNLQPIVKKRNLDFIG